MANPKFKNVKIPYNIFEQFSDACEWENQAIESKIEFLMGNYISATKEKILGSELYFKYDFLQNK